jgi:hypothetical protein
VEMDNQLSKKKLQEIKKQKEEERQNIFEEYKRQLDEDYLDLNSEEIMDFYEAFLDKMNNRLGFSISGRYGEFVNFLVENSSDRDIFREEKIKEYLEELSENEEENEIEEEEEVEKYDFLYFKGGY